MASLSTFFDTAHFLARCMRYRFHTEKLEIKTLMQLDLTGATALDIGANKGIYCFWMLRAVGRSGRVVAFEPQPEMAETIRQKQARFDWANLEIINVALSDAEGKSNLARDSIGDGSASLETSRHRAGQDSFDVPVTRLDAIPDDLLANPTKARQCLGWNPELSFERLVSLMVDEDLASLRQTVGQGTRQASMDRKAA